jgi:hypothetical protein
MTVPVHALAQAAHAAPGSRPVGHWNIRAAGLKHEWRHCLTLHEAMEQSRAAWDLLEPDGTAIIG